MKKILSAVLLAAIMLTMVSCACDKIEKPETTTAINTESTVSDNVTSSVKTEPPVTTENNPKITTEAKVTTEPVTTAEPPIIIEPDKTELTSYAKALVGTWKYERNMADVLNAQLAAAKADTDLSIVKTDSFPVTYVLTFASDKTVELKVDEESVRKTLDSYIVLMKDKLTTYMTRKFNETLAKYGVTDMTPDQLLESQGLGYTKVSDWCSDIIDETVDKEAIVSAFSAQKTGLFNANEFRIFFYDAEYSEEDYAEYVLSEGKLTLTAVSELYKSEWDSILPVTFTK